MRTGGDSEPPHAPVSSGMPMAGVVVGGTSIHGGEGAIWRTVVGVLFIALIGNGFDLLSIDPLVQQIILGVILLLAVGLDAIPRLRT